MGVQNPRGPFGYGNPRQFASPNANENIGCEKVMRLSDIMFGTVGFGMQITAVREFNVNKAPTDIGAFEADSPLADQACNGSPMCLIGTFAGLPGDQAPCILGAAIRELFNGLETAPDPEVFANQWVGKHVSGLNSIPNLGGKIADAVKAAKKQVYDQAFGQAMAELNAPEPGPTS